MRYKREKKKLKRKEKEPFVSEGGLLKTTSNYTTFHICFTMGSFTPDPTLDVILQCYKEKVSQMQIDQNLVVCSHQREANKQF